MRRLLPAVVLLLLAPLAFAQAYKWTDAGGTVHYSETPPASGTSYEKIKTSGSADPIATPAAVTDDADSRSEADATASAEPMEDTPENRARLCATLEVNLDALQGGGPVVMQRDGRDTALDASQRKIQLATAQAQHEQYCQG